MRNARTTALAMFVCAAAMQAQAAPQDRKATRPDAQQPVENRAPNSGLFEAVAGQWGWEGTSDCKDNRQTISFSDDRERMTIRQMKTYKLVDGRSTDTAQYKVLYAEANRITAYIENELRRTNAGDRVVWVLMLTDRDHFAWRRTDWESSQVTKPLVRCKDQ